MGTCQAVELEVATLERRGCSVSLGNGRGQRVSRHSMAGERTLDFFLARNHEFVIAQACALFGATAANPETASRSVKWLGDQGCAGGQQRCSGFHLITTRESSRTGQQGEC